jgi:esterase/lipase superfamily enzyme
VGNSIRLGLVALCAIALAGCASPGNFDTGATTIRALNASAADPAKEIHFVTTRCNDDPAAGAPGTSQELFRKRCWEASLDNEEMHRLGFGMAESDHVSCGSVTVDVAVTGAPSDVATTVSTPALSACGDFGALRQAIAATPCRCAFIFVHGYNTTFGYGLRRTAQLALDLSYQGVPILFSFAAGGRFGDYVNDAEAAELAAPALHQLLLALSRGDGTTAPAIDVVAHSMGGRLTLRAIGEGEAPSLRYVVMAAPDIDPAAFLQLAGKAAAHARRLTVYTAKYDVAMAASAAAHDQRPRVGAGLSASVAQDLAHAEIIDATARATDPYAHSYFAESKVVLDDIKAALQGKPAAERSPLQCAPAGAAVACTIPCPPGASCGPSLYARIVHWLFD